MTTNDERRTILEQNLLSVRERIARAVDRSHRDPDSVRLVAVTKYVDAEVARLLHGLGVADFGENRIQTAEPKLEALCDLKIRWHWIGNLQTNKVRKVLGRFHVFHSVDRIPLIEALEERLEASVEEKPSPPLPVYLQVNVSGEGSKSGFSPEEAIRGGERLLESLRFEWVGLMTLAPYFENPEQSRPTFAGLREIRDRLEGRLGIRLPRLSMGMSGDFEPAIEEGATDVRIGSLLYEGLR